jgi:ELWxxDGT repeat protein
MARAFFNGFDMAGTRGLWVTNGTAATTKEIAAGLDPTDPVVFNGELLFSATKGLWVTDGTTAGTDEIIVNGASAAAGVHPSDLTVFNN